MQPTLIIMAAGIGSRYGGIKQIDPVGQCGEIMLDYSVFDAIQAGFGKVVFIIRKTIEKDFKKVIGTHFTGRIPVIYVFQELTDIPNGFSVPSERTKPWGTAHAILATSDIVKEPFAVINADDFYSKQSYEILARFLQKLSCDTNTYAMVGFQLGNTLSDHGYVARGICKTDNSDMLISVHERLKIEKIPDGARYTDESGQWVNLSGLETASMNMFGFTPSLFTFLRDMFPQFLKGAVNNPTAEFLIPSVVDRLIQKKKITMQVLKTSGKWFGMTYKEDKPKVIANICNLIDSGIYPERLWGRE